MLAMTRAKKDSSSDGGTFLDSQGQKGVKKGRTVGDGSRVAGGVRVEGEVQLR